MFTSDTKKHFLISLFIYVGMSAFLFAFSRIYTHFSFGQSSPYMNNMFLITTFGGLIAILVQLAILGYKKIFKVTYNLWNSGLACIVTGMLIRGIINISGRSTTADRYYMYAGGAFLIASAIAFAISLILFRKDNNPPKKRAVA